MEKPIIAKHIFKVKEKIALTPHYIRIRLYGEGVPDFAPCTLGANNKIFIPPAGSNKVQFSTFDPAAGEWVMPDESVKPTVRTYTHRQIDVENNEIVIDFVNHGDNGPASSWARAAQVDDELGVAMKVRETVLYPEGVDWYLLVGDATAIPVLSCILESLPPTGKGRCVIEVGDQSDIHPEIQHPGFEVQWIFNPHPEQGSTLSNDVRAVTWPEEGRTFAYVACEYSSVKEIRRYFKEDLGLGNADFYAFSYWKAGVAEDKSAAERREEKK